MYECVAEVGGGSKQKFRWVDTLRIPKDWPQDKELIENVLSINYDPIRSSCLAMTGYADRLRWQIATTNMKAGDLIRSTTEIPEMTVKPLEGNSHPLGALPVGTEICMVQQIPGEGKVCNDVLTKVYWTPQYQD